MAASGSVSDRDSRGAQSQRVAERLTEPRQFVRPKFSDVDKTLHQRLEGRQVHDLLRQLPGQKDASRLRFYAQGGAVGARPEQIGLQQAFVDWQPVAVFQRGHERKKDARPGFVVGLDLHDRAVVEGELAKPTVVERELRDANLFAKFPDDVSEWIHRWLLGHGLAEQSRVLLGADYPARWTRRDYFRNLSICPSDGRAARSAGGRAASSRGGPVRCGLFRREILRPRDLLGEIGIEFEGGPLPDVAGGRPDLDVVGAGPGLPLA